MMTLNLKKLDNNFTITDISFVTKSIPWKVFGGFESYESFKADFYVTTE